MKKMRFLLIFAAILASIYAVGCDKDMKRLNPVQPTPAPVVPTSIATPADTPTPAPTPTPGTLYVTASVTTSAGNTGASVILADGSAAGAAVIGATVIINGITLADSGTGGYMPVFPLLPLINAGDTVTMSITSSVGNVSATGTFPAAGGGVATVTVTDAVAGSSLTLTNN
jgi:hypothetical protein